jgi:hypothetical protein
MLRIRSDLGLDQDPPSKKDRLQNQICFRIRPYLVKHTSQFVQHSSSTVFCMALTCISLCHSKLICL